MTRRLSEPLLHTPAHAVGAALGKFTHETKRGVAARPRSNEWDSLVKAKSSGITTAGSALVEDLRRARAARRQFREIARVAGLIFQGYQLGEVFSVGCGGVAAPLERAAGAGNGTGTI